MIRSIIVDDERNSRDSLATLLAEYCPDVDVIAKCANAKEALLKIAELKPDLVFLDVEMPGMGGFELLQAIGNLNFEVVFVTAFDQYAVKAIKLSALDYLLKPVDTLELINAVEKFNSKKNEVYTAQQMQLLLHNFKPANKNFSKIALPSADGISFVELDEIIRLGADANYTHFFLTNKQDILVSRTLKDYEEVLTEHNFLRVHQSHLINLKHIKKYMKADGGYVVMSDGAAVSVSTRKRSEVIDFLTRM